MRKRTPTLWLTAWLLVLGSVLIPSSGALAQSSIDSDIQQMFQNWGLNANVTLPGAYQAQSRGMITGGSLSMRVQQVQPPLLTVSPPQFNIGCGGIDFFFGGLSFLNGKSAVKWVENTLQQIAMGALSYGFHIALDAVCSTCNTQLKHIAQTVQQWQKMMSDSCQLGKQLAAGMFGPSTGSARLEAQVTDCVQQSQLGTDGLDADSASNVCSAGTSTSGPSGATGGSVQSLWDQVVGAKAAGLSGAGTPLVMTPGNALWDGLTKVQGYADDQRVTVQSLVGTFLCYIPPPPGGSSSGSIPLTCDYTGHSINLRDFLYGNDNAQCIMNKDELSNYTGNTPPPVNYQACAINGYLPLVTSQIKSVVNDLPTQLTPEDQKFIESSNVPILGLLAATKSSKDLQAAAIDMTADLIAIVMAVEQVKGYIRVAEMAISHQTEIDAAQMQARIDDVKRDLYDQVNQEFLLFNSQFRTYELVEFFERQVAQHGSSAVVKAFRNMSQSPIR